MSKNSRISPGRAARSVRFDGATQGALSRENEEITMRYLLLLTTIVILSAMALPARSEEKGTGDRSTPTASKVNQSTAERPCTKVCPITHACLSRE